MSNTTRKEVATAYAKKFLNYHGEVEYIGQGFYAHAFSIGDKVIKITRDMHDVINCSKLIGKNFKHLVKVYSANRLKNYEAVVADYHAYERITGQLEPFMIDRIAEMEAVLNNN